MCQFMLESVKYWIDEYHIDGFRFDLIASCAISKPGYPRW